MKPLLTRRVMLQAAIGLAGLIAGLSQWGAPAQASDPATQRYICVASDCTPYIYDPAIGDPDNGIPPGTAFRDIPNTWGCPDCGAGKADFIPLG